MNVSEIVELAGQYEAHLPELQMPAGHPDDRPFAQWLDQTLLKPEATPDQIAKLCMEAREYGFAAVCVNPLYAEMVVEMLEGSQVKPCSVIGFPLGATLTRTKNYETRACLERGIKEIDMVIQVGTLRQGDYCCVMEDIQAVVETSHAYQAQVKVILEMALLNQREKIIGCLLTQAAGADFVKTSTGFGPGGATAADVELMRRVVGPNMGVKAAGGVRTLADARTMLAAGATRLGTSAGAKIIQEFLAEKA